MKKSAGTNHIQVRVELLKITDIQGISKFFKNAACLSMDLPDMPDRRQSTPQVLRFASQAFYHCIEFDKFIKYYFSLLNSFRVWAAPPFEKGGWGGFPDFKDGPGLLNDSPVEPQKSP